MDPIHIHNLLRQIANEVKCPHCEAPVRPDMIFVENSTENYCMLKIACHSCAETFQGHAHIGVKVVPSEHALSPQPAAITGKLPPTPLPVSEHDLQTVNTVLKDNVPISEFLP